MILSNYEFYANCLKRVIDGEKFYNVLNKDIKNFAAENNEKKDAQAIIGSCIRHYLFFYYTLKTKFKLSNEELIYIVLYILNDYYFTRRYKKEDLIETLNDYISKKSLECDVEAIFKYFDSKTPFELLKDEFNNNVNVKYFSLRYNVPEWIVAMISKQYSMTNAVKTIKAFSSKQRYYVKINEKLHTPDEIKIKETEFTPSTDGMYEYIGKTALRKHPLINNFFLYQTNYFDNEIIRKCKIHLGDSIAVFDDVKTNLVLELFNKADKENIFNFFSSDYSKLIKSLEYLRKYRHEKLVYDQCNVDELDARISRKVNLFLVIPKSSNFTNVNSSPEYLINFKQNTLTEIIEYQGKAIQEASKHVLIGGNLVYLTYTLNKKENNLIVEKFLKDNPGWHLVEEKTVFPNSTEVTCGYYAILHREL
jgi:16S rRNA C967 or C1407 C5-methylase (RsmB/RsmF family)